MTPKTLMSALQTPLQILRNQVDLGWRRPEVQPAGGGMDGRPFQTCFQAALSLMPQSQNRLLKKADQERSRGGRKVFLHTKGTSLSVPRLEPGWLRAHTERTPTCLPCKAGCRQNALSQEQKNQARLQTSPTLQGFLSISQTQKPHAGPHQLRGH